MFGHVSRRTLGAAALFAIASLPALRAEPAAVSSRLGSHVRGSNAEMNVLIARGAQRSPTFRKLIEVLNASDVIVYIESSGVLPAGLDGRLSFMTAAGGVRYLHVQVLNGRGFEELIAIAGHELQHAVEVAAHSEVRDSPALARLYERIGIPSHVKNRYDTTAAQSTGKRVRAELG